MVDHPSVRSGRSVVKLVHDDVVKLGRCKPLEAGLAPAKSELTPRQEEILGLVAQGLIYKNIAQRLHLSEKTVKYHMGQILEKLRVENRAQAIAYYQQLQQK